MAAFFHAPVSHAPASTGVVIHAERRFARGRAPAGDRLACNWTRAPDGRLIRVWQSEASSKAAEPKPLAPSSAA